MGVGIGMGMGVGIGMGMGMGIGIGIPDLTVPDTGIAVRPRTTVVLDVKPNSGNVTP